MTNGTPADRLTGGNLGSLTGRPDDRIAFIGLDTGREPREWRFGEIDRRADALATALAARGYDRGTRIAILAVNSVEYIITLLAVMRTGLVAVPVNFKLPPALIAFILADSGARLVFCDAAHREELPPQYEAIVFSTAPFEALLTGDAPFAAFQPGPDDLALILYTSGSSGRPKGVRLSHASHRWVVETRRAATPLEGERLLIAAPLYHMNALALVLLALACHATAVLLPQFKADAYIAAIGRYRCSWLTAVPPMIAMMLKERDLLAQSDLSSVRVIRMGSAPVSPSLREQIARLLPNAKIINAYGTTEGSPVVFGPHPDGLPTPPQSVGYPHPEVQLRLVDETGRESDHGVLQIKSPGLMAGYHQRPELTPFTPDGFYSTGDVFQRDGDGFYSFVGRQDDMFVSGGENLYPGDIEKALERHPAVLQACVVPVADEIKGTKPVAFVTLRHGVPAPGEEELKAFSLKHLAAYQHPRRIWFVDALPLAATQKIDRRHLVAEAARRVDGQP